MTSPDPRRWSVVAVIVGISLGVVALLAHLLLSATACSFDTSYCAAGLAKNGTYEGRLTTQDGQPYSDREFLVRFESRRNQSPVGFHTGSDGRFCIEWPREAVTPFPEQPDETLLTVHPSHSPFSPPEQQMVWQPLNGRDPPPGCDPGSEGVPWHRARGLGTRWQFWLLALLPLAAVAALGASLVRSRLSRRLLVAGLAALGVDLALGLLLWNLL
jgi:hypothetical protein